MEGGLIDSATVDQGGSLLDGGGPECPPGEYPCIKRVCAETFYLYDGGALLATFDERDSVIDLFVNGPTGRLATYWHNNDTLLYYFVSDHTGSPRVIMSPRPTPHVVAWYNYYPFGDLKESWTAYDTPFKFTGKERDDHSSFHYYYFGARYYDPYLGRFTSIDKAGQFASGYVYGGNYPTMGVDPDGNVFFLFSTPFLMGFFFGGGSYWAAAGNDFRLDQFLGYALFGGLAGSVTAYWAKYSSVAGTFCGSFVNGLAGKFIENKPFEFTLGPVRIGDEGIQTDPATLVTGYLTMLEDMNKLGPKHDAFDPNTNTLEIRGKQKVQLSPEATKLMEENLGQNINVETLQPVDPPALKKGDYEIRCAGTGPGSGAKHFYVQVDAKTGRIAITGHVDGWGSGLKNIGTMAQHILFEGLPYNLHNFNAFVGDVAHLALGVGAASYYRYGYMFQQAQARY